MSREATWAFANDAPPGFGLRKGVAVSIYDLEVDHVWRTAVTYDTAQGDEGKAWAMIACGLEAIEAGEW